MTRKEDEPTIVSMGEGLHAPGVGVDTSDRKIYRDAAELGRRLEEARREHPFEARRPRLFVAASSGHDREAGAYHYAMGDVVASLDGRRIEHFEYHDERASRRRRPEIEIRVPVAPKASGIATAAGRGARPASRRAPDPRFWKGRRGRKTFSKKVVLPRDPAPRP